jgi:drug/metabolite transporter (DMT)-like permease
MKINLKIFCLLSTAYAVSMAYQFYRSQLNQYPAYDTFATTEIVGYSVLFAWSSISLINKKWSLWSIVVLCIVQLGIGFVYYLPVFFLKRHDTFWDWAELVIFIFLIAIAGYFAIAQLNHFKKESRLKKVQA